MFKRQYINDLIEWKNKKSRKPLILRGARQVGKTTLVKQFSNEFPRFIHLNLEKEEHRNIFEKSSNIREIIDAIFFLFKQKKDSKETLIFIDEIQNSSKAISYLRYFYEDFPELYIIAAGSLLETLLSEKISFPVGRVEFLPVRPCSFIDFLSAMGEDMSIEILSEIPVPDYTHEKFLSLFNKYTLIGGMPEVVSNYSLNGDLIEVNKILSNLLATYNDDVEKYATSSISIQYIRHILKTGFSYSGQRIKFEGFGESNYKSREMGEAFRILEKAFLLELIYPTTVFKIPLITDYKKSPRLHWFDIGLTNYFAGVQNDVFFTKNIDYVWKGSVAELIVGQELIAYEKDILNKRSFWVRQAKNSTAKVDYILNVDGFLIPIEVKMTAGSHLKSLYIFLDNAPHGLGIRIWSKKFEDNELITENNKKIKLINVPFYNTFNLKEIVKKYI